MISVHKQKEIHYKRLRSFDLNSIRWLAEYYKKNNKENQMIKFLKLAIRTNNDSNAMLELGTLYYDKGNKMNAKKYCEMAYRMALNLRNFDAVAKLASYYDSLGENEKVEQLYMFGIASKNKNCIFNWAKKCEEQDNLDEAIKHYQICFDLYKCSDSIHNILKIYYEQKKYENILDYADIIKNDSNLKKNIKNLEIIGKAYCQLKQFDKMADFYSITDEIEHDNLLNKSYDLKNISYELRFVLLKYYELYDKNFEKANQQYSILIGMPVSTFRQHEYLKSFSRKFGIFSDLLKKSKLVNGKINCLICCEDFDKSIQMFCCKQKMCNKCLQGVIKTSGFNCPFCRKQYNYNVNYDIDLYNNESFYHHIGFDEQLNHNFIDGVYYEDEEYDNEEDDEEDDDEEDEFRERNENIIFNDNNDDDSEIESDSGGQYDI